ncbi:MAG: aconitate hydratase AcnA [Pseudomonadota bacterium]|nr:aconitate hydratase AcnA [Pseudomonadota bacterium]
MSQSRLDSFSALQTLTVDDQTYHYASLKSAEEVLGDLSALPFSLKVLLENLLRHEDGQSVSTKDIEGMKAWLDKRSSENEVAFHPARVLMQDFTGVPGVVDLAAMREAAIALGGKAEDINPLSAVDLVIDHSVMVDNFGTEQAFEQNVQREFERNKERYEFLKWGSKAFSNFRVVPPGTGICHQVNLEYLGKTVWSEKNEQGQLWAFPDSLVGTDSHTTMINALSVLGWGVGGIEAEAAMLGQPISMLIPEVIGFELTGELKEGATATDLVLRVVQMLREKGVVGKFVEFYGEGLGQMSIADRATISNMAPEYGATCGFFPIDQETLTYLEFTGREPHQIKLVEAYAKAQCMWRDNDNPPVFTDTLHLNLGDVEPSIAGPKRPQDRITLSEAASAFESLMAKTISVKNATDVVKMMSEGRQLAEYDQPNETDVAVEGEDFSVDHGDVVIAAITSCTNTSNPSVMMAAGLVAKKAVEKGLSVKPWVKTSLAPGSQVVTDYLEQSGLQDDLDKLGFNLVGYGCTTCIGNSGPLPPAISAAVNKGNLTVTSVLSGNRNFEGRISPDVKANYLASPPLIVAYALMGTMTKDITTEAIGEDASGEPVYLKDIWPTTQEIVEQVRQFLTPEMFTSRYANVFDGTQQWQDVGADDADEAFDWEASSTYIKKPPFFEGMSPMPTEGEAIKGAHILALLGDTVTTDHISPAGSIKEDSPAGRYLKEHGVEKSAFNSYGSRRGNHEVMMRGTFANIRIKNLMLDGVEGGYTRYVPTGEQMAIYDAAMKYQKEQKPLVVFGGKEYGTGSSRDWAAKGTILLGVKAVITESYERIHRSNLIGMGVLPLQFTEGKSWKSLELTGDELIDITGIESGVQPKQSAKLHVHRSDGSTDEHELLVRIDTADEAAYFKHGGILHYVLRQITGK